MQSKIQVSPDHTLLEVHLSGNVTGQELISLYDKVSNEVECVAQIWDFLGADSIEISNTEMHQIAGVSRRLSSKSKIQKQAIVGHRETLRGLDEMYDLISDKWVGRPNHFVSRTFGTLLEAYDWVQHGEQLSKSTL